MNATSYPAEVAAVRASEDLNWPRAVAHLQSQIDGIGTLLDVKQFPNGAANLTYLLKFAERQVVLRRPPFGEIAVGAHDMGREYRVLSALSPHFDRAPTALLFCEDPDVVGAPFLVTEYRSGQGVWGGVPPTMRAHKDVARRMGMAVIDALSDLHMLDLDECGLRDLGKAEGFLDRQVAGWQRRWNDVADEALVALIDDLTVGLANTIPSAGGASLLHNDFKIDNCQFDPGVPDRVKTIFDWDMATLGEPLVDLGTLLNYWPDPTDPPGQEAIFPAGLDRMALPTRGEIVNRYATRTGKDVSTARWFEAFAAWKTAVILRQLYVRLLRGESSDERNRESGARVEPQLRRALRLLEGR